MAALPPRLDSTSKQKTERTKSALDVLMQMGFPKTRAEKAIASTGDHSVQIASDWLLSHVNDPLLDKQNKREYTLYLCPSGPLKAALIEFWEKSRKECGWNGAHAYMPHITLCPFFQSADNLAPLLSKVLQSLQGQLSKYPGSLTLTYFSKTHYIGLFPNDLACKFFHDLVTQFASEVSKAGVTVQPQVDQLHLSLAYKFQPDQGMKLEKLAREIDINASAQWELHLYSRFARPAQREVFRVISPYTPQLGDEVDLILNDYIFVDQIDISESKDGWYLGTSWLTGSIGMFPGNFTERTADTWTWALHRSVPLLTQSLQNGSADPDYDNLWLDEEPSNMYAQVNKKNPTTGNASLKFPVFPRKLFVVRHGERVDVAFGRAWLEKCFDDAGNYKRLDLNLPPVVHPRDNHMKYYKDTPLTEIGKVQARLTGEALKEAGVSFSFVYSSPSLRCIETTHEILKGMHSSCSICIEPGVFEWVGWYRMGMPKWFSPEDLQHIGYPINVGYSPFKTPGAMPFEETIEEYYTRCYEFTKQALKKHEDEGGNTLIVAHAGSLDVCTRQLLSKQPLPHPKFEEAVRNVPFCGLCMCEEDQVTKKWELKDPPIPPLTHEPNKLFSWKCLLR